MPIYFCGKISPLGKRKQEKRKKRHFKSPKLKFSYWFNQSTSIYFCGKISAFGKKRKRIKKKRALQKAPNDFFGKK
jgi:hypothetical protein